MDSCTSPEKDQICLNCQKWVSLLGCPYGERYTHHSSFAALQKSASSCKFCRIIFDGFEKDGTQAREIHAAAEEGYPTVVEFEGLNHRGVLSGQNDSGWHGLIGIEVYCGQPGMNDDWRIELRLYSDTGT